MSTERDADPGAEPHADPAPADQDEIRIRARTFLILTISASVPAFDIGFEAGAFRTVSYHRVVTVFVISTVVLIWSFATRIKDPIATSWRTRAILAVPALYLLLDETVLRTSRTESEVLFVAVIATFPYVLYLLAKIVAPDYFSMPPRERVIAAVVVVALAVGGYYIGRSHPRFLHCVDFSRVGDYVPPNCQKAQNAYTTTALGGLDLAHTRVSDLVTAANRG